VRSIAYKSFKQEKGGARLPFLATNGGLLLRTDSERWELLERSIRRVKVFG